MKAEAPPIIGPLEFAGLKNQLILVEFDEEDDVFFLIYSAIVESSGVIYITNQESIKDVMLELWVGIILDSIATINKRIRKIMDNVDYHIIHRIDLMDLKLCKKVRGSQIKAYLSMLSPNILRGSNVIVTSCSDEHTIREIADVYLNLRK